MKNTLATLGNSTALQLIKGYQRYVSPIKGFKCASGYVHGDTTCSAAIRQIVQQQGLIEGIPAIQQQLKRCHAAARQLAAMPGQPHAGVFCCILPVPL